MKYPYVETKVVRWDFRSIYYDAQRPAPSGEARSGEPTCDSRESLRVDIGSATLEYAEVLREATALGGSDAERMDATLYWVADEVACEMRVSTTRAALNELAEILGLPIDASFSRQLALRARSIMTGAALVGALRGIAWQLATHKIDSYRAELIADARHEVQRSGMVSGKAGLMADDAHAHLRLAERVRPGYENEWMLLARRGTLLLGAALAQAVTEPWNPFLHSRLNKESLEHAATLEKVMAAEKEIKVAFDATALLLRQVHQEANEAFAANEHGPGGDLAAYFGARRLAATQLPGPELPELVRQFLDIEKNVERLT